MTTASATATMTACSVPDGAAAAETVRLSGSRYGHCATPHVTTTLGHRTDGEQSSASRGVAGQQHKSADTADGAENRERQRRRGEAVEKVGRVTVQHEEADDAEHRDDDGGTMARRRK